MTPASSKDRGHLATLQLVVEVQKRDWLALWPEGDNAPYDIMVEPEPGKFIRVQVKSCREMDAKGRHSYVIGHGSDHTKRYSKKTVDIMALYAFDTNEWYFVPVEKTYGYSNLHISQKGKWAAFKNNWGAF